jgi:hypothetical protein
MPVRSQLSQIERAILQTVAYSDVFDYPLTDQEIQRYLAGMAAPLEVVQEALRSKHLGLEERQGYFTLPGRSGTVEIRQRRAAWAERRPRLPRA